MLRGKLLAGILIVVVIIGCAKKKVQSDTEFSQSAKKTVQSQSSTADIFEEFYKEDSSIPESSASSTAPAVPQEKPSSYKNTAATADASHFTSNGRYVVQVSTVGSRSLAEHLVEQLEAKGYPAYVAEVQNPTPQLFGTYYRIRIGRFAQISAARTFGDEILKPMGYEFWVDNKSNDNVGIQGSGFGESTPASDFNSTPSYQNYQTYPPVQEQNTPAAVTYPAVSEQSTPAVNYPPPPSVTPAPSIPVEPAATAPAATPASGGTAEVPLDDEW